MRKSIKKFYEQAIQDSKQSSAENAKWLALKLRAEYYEIKSLVDYGFWPDEAIQILGNFPSLIINKI